MNNETTLPEQSPKPSPYSIDKSELSPSDQDVTEQAQLAQVDLIETQAKLIDAYKQLEDISTPNPTRMLDGNHKITESSPKNKKISRRDFLRKSALLGAEVALAATGIDRLTGGHLQKVVEHGAEVVINKSIGVAEVAESQLKSQTNYEHDRLSVESSETLISDQTFTIKRLNVSVEGEGTDFSPVLAEIDGAARIDLQPLSTKRREEIIETNPSAIAGPMGYIDGQYHRMTSNAESLLDITFVYPAQTADGIKFGPNEIVDRFPGAGEQINLASGGLVFSKHGLKLAGKSELETAQENGAAFAQMVFYLDENNADDVLSQSWTHWKKENIIGNTVYYWGAYLQYDQNGEVKTAIAVNDLEMVPMRYFVELAKELSDNGKFKVVFTDGGNGASIIGTSESHPDKRFAYGANEFDTHLVPAAVQITP